MPSSKAVLRDIHDLKLDPKVAHKGYDHAGRLSLGVKKPVTVHHVKHQKPVVVEPEPVVEEIVEEVKVDVEPIVEVKPEPVVEEVKAPEVKVDEVKPEPKQEPEHKPKAKPKKDEKKSEEPKVS